MILIKALAKMQLAFNTVHLSVFLVVFLQILSSAKAECVFNQYSYLDSGVFLQQFGENDTIVNFQGNPIRIPDQGHIEAVCSSGFRFPGHPAIFGTADREVGRDYEEYRNVSILCQNGDVEYSFPGGLKQDAVNNNLICKDNKARFYKSDVRFCSETGFIYGFMVKEVPITVAEVCYNLNQERTQFVHFVAGRRSLLLQRQTEHNPSTLSTSLEQIQKYVFPRQAELFKILGKTFAIPGYLRLAEYKLEYLAPIANFTSHIGNMAHNYEIANVIPIWTTLSNYNWGFFEELLRKQSEKENLDIIAGTSGHVHYPYDLRCNLTAEFEILEDGIQIDVPLHIWYSIRTKGKSDSTFVVIAVNTPIVEVNGNSIICNDICDEISWLRPLENSRRIASLGYIYCCKPNDVSKILSGFPHMEREARAKGPDNPKESSNSGEVHSKEKPKII